MKQYNIGILAVQEMRWKGEGIMASGDFTVFYKGGQSKNMFGTGFIVNNVCKELILNFNGINDRISYLRLKGKFFNTILINVHAPTEEKEPEVKEMLYDILDGVYNRLPTYDVKIVLGDFNAKVGREVEYKEIAGRHSLHEISNDNGIRLIDFAKDKHLVVKSTMFPRKNIHKQTWISPDGLTKNQIDHLVLIEKTYNSHNRC